MNIYFVEPERSEQLYLDSSLPGHQLHFLSAEQEVPESVEFLSIFINTIIDRAFLEAHPHLQLISTRSTTYDHIDLGECRRRGITVCHVPSYGDFTVAEHTFALLLAVARRLREATVFPRESFCYESLRGFQLHGKTLGVIGTGRIGQHVLQLGKAFGMICIACDIAENEAAATGIGYNYVTFAELLSRSDVISLHTPLTPQTYHLLNRETLALCKPGVTIINTARGGLIDVHALLESMEDGNVAGVGLDVLEDERILRRRCSHIVSSQIIDRIHGIFLPAEPRHTDPERVTELARLIDNEALLSRPNVVFTPHIAFNSIEAVECINRTTAENLLAYFQGRPINVIAQPESNPAASSEAASSPEAHVLHDLHT